MALKVEPVERAAVDWFAPGEITWLSKPIVGNVKFSAEKTRMQLAFEACKGKLQTFRYGEHESSGVVGCFSLDEIVEVTEDVLMQGKYVWKTFYKAEPNPPLAVAKEYIRLESGEWVLR